MHLSILAHFIWIGLIINLERISGHSIPVKIYYLFMDPNPLNTINLDKFTNVNTTNDPNQPHEIFNPFCRDFIEAISDTVRNATKSLCTYVGLHLSCVDLVKADGSSKINPYCVSYVKDSTNSWVLLDKTEVAINSTDVNFSTTIKVKYTFQAKQTVKIDIYDKVNENIMDLPKQSLLGSIEFILPSLIIAKEKTYDIANGLAHGKIKVACEALKENNTDITFKITLPSVNTFVIISKKSTKWVPIYLSDTATGTNYQLNDTVFNAIVVCDNDFNQPILFELYEHQANEDNIKKGEKATTINQLANSSTLTIECKSINSH